MYSQNLLLITLHFCKYDGFLVMFYIIIVKLEGRAFCHSGIYFLYRYAFDFYSWYLFCKFTVKDFVPDLYLDLLVINKL